MNRAPLGKLSGDNFPIIEMMWNSRNLEEHDLVFPGRRAIFLHDQPSRVRIPLSQECVRLALR